MADLDQLTQELTSQHAALTKAYETEQVTAEAAWAKFDAAKAKLQAFRAKYGAVVKALESGAVKVEG